MGLSIHHMEGSTNTDLTDKGRVHEFPYKSPCLGLSKLILPVKDRISPVLFGALNNKNAGEVQG